MTRRILVLPALAAGFGLLLTGCGSSSGHKAGSTSSPSATSSASATPAATMGMTSAAATIKSNWEAFFASSTPVSKRVSLLQNGSQFQSVIAQQDKSSLASSAAAKVTKVSGVTSTQGKVTYTITLGGQAALPNQTGMAVNQDGTWKVGDKSFCGLLALELGKAKLPAACSSAG